MCFERLQAYLDLTGQALGGVEDYLQGAQAKLALVSHVFVALAVVSDILPGHFARR